MPAASKRSPPKSFRFVFSLVYTYLVYSQCMEGWLVREFMYYMYMCLCVKRHRTCRGHVRLVEEDSAEVFFVGENFGLLGEERSAAVDHVDARQPVLTGNFLHAEQTW